MGAKLPHDCQGCSKLSIDDARKKRCWSDASCHGLRSYWGNRDEIAIKRKLKRQAAKQIAPIPSLGLEIEPDYYLHVDFYRDRKLDPLRAIAIEVRKGGTVKFRQPPIDCLGKPPWKVKEIMRLAISEANQMLGINLTKYSSRAELAVSRLESDIV
jgi:hypothetical protein